MSVCVPACFIYSWRNYDKIWSKQANFVIAGWNSNTYPDNNAFRSMGHNGIVVTVCTVCMETHNQVEVALIRVWFPFLTHIVGCCFTKV